MQIILRPIADKTGFRGLLLLFQNFGHIVFRLNRILAGYRAFLPKWRPCASLLQEVLFSFWTKYLRYWSTICRAWRFFRLMYRWAIRILSLRRDCKMSLWCLSSFQLFSAWFAFDEIFCTLLFQSSLQFFLLHSVNTVKPSFINFPCFLNHKLSLVAILLLQILEEF